MGAQLSIDTLVDHPEVTHALYGTLHVAGHVSIGRKFGREPAVLGHKVGNIEAFLQLPYSNGLVYEAIFDRSGTDNDALNEHLEAFVFNPDGCRRVGEPMMYNKNTPGIGFGIIKHGYAYDRHETPVRQMVKYPRGNGLTDLLLRAMGNGYREVEATHINITYTPKVKQRKKMAGVMFQFADFRFDRRFPGQTKYAVLLPVETYHQLVEVLERDPLQMVRLYRAVFPDHANAVGTTVLRTTLDFEKVLFIRDQEDYQRLDKIHRQPSFAEMSKKTVRF